MPWHNEARRKGEEHRRKNDYENSILRPKSLWMPNPPAAWIRLSTALLQKDWKAMSMWKNVMEIWKGDCWKLVKVCCNDCQCLACHLAISTRHKAWATIVQIKSIAKESTMLLNLGDVAEMWEFVEKLKRATLCLPSSAGSNSWTFTSLSFASDPKDRSQCIGDLWNRFSSAAVTYVQPNSNRSPYRFIVSVPPIESLLRTLRGEEAMQRVPSARI